MKLADYLYENAMTPSHCRRLLGVKHRSTMLRWLTGDRVPSRAMCDRISLLTNNHVRRKDFYDPAPPKCAIIVHETDGETPTVVLPWSPQYEELKRREEEIDQTDASLSPAIQRAIRVLNGRAVFAPTGRFLLDGRQVDLKRVVQEANDNLTNHGEAPIPYPNVSPLHE
ncbi:MAG: hypothetical protein RLN60_03320 [Phycisphaerales bacterium]